MDTQLAEEPPAESARPRVDVTEVHDALLDELEEAQAIVEWLTGKPPEREELDHRGDRTLENLGPELPGESGQG